MQIELATDGGGSREGEGAAACILIDRSAKLRLKIACFIGPANGDEAEIMAAILGLCTVRALAESESQKLNSVVWTTDSQYLVRMSTLLKDFERSSAANPSLTSNHPLSTDFRANLALWKTWERLVFQVPVLANWTKGHAGHRENEACDKACRWLQQKGKKLLRENGEGPIGQQSKIAKGQSWILVDGSGVLSEIFELGGEREGEKLSRLREQIALEVANYRKSAL